jgi:predicted methyltransferase MtxX (methanogen marker protein 4)
VRSRNNSRAPSAANTPTQRPKGLLEKLADKKLAAAVKGSTPSLERAALKLAAGHLKTPTTPKVKRK